MIKNAGKYGPGKYPVLFVILPANGRFYSPDALQPRIELFDVTADGCDDLCTCVTWGSGMVRTDLVVYDPLNEDLYVLDGYS